jgi:hypothetical protein
MLGGLQRTLYF